MKLVAIESIRDRSIPTVRISGRQHTLNAAAMELRGEYRRVEFFREEESGKLLLQFGDNGLLVKNFSKSQSGYCYNPALAKYAGLYRLLPGVGEYEGYYILQETK
jgi:hypothetical protein